MITAWKARDTKTTRGKESSRSRRITKNTRSKWNIGVYKARPRCSPFPMAELGLLRHQGSRLQIVERSDAWCMENGSVRICCIMHVHRHFLEHAPVLHRMLNNSLPVHTSPALQLHCWKQLVSPVAVDAVVLVPV